MSTNTNHQAITSAGRAPTDMRPADEVISLLAAELGAELVHQGPGRGCPGCTERDDRVAA